MLKQNWFLSTQKHRASQKLLKWSAKIFPFNQNLEQTEEELIEFKGKHQMTPNKVSSEQIKNEGLSLISEHPTSEDCFESKFQSKISPSNKIFKQPEEELIEFKERKQMEPNKFSS